VSFDYAGVLRVLQEHDVRYVLIGGLAANALGSATATYDLDICYARDADNLERLARALRAMNARLRGLDEDVPFLLDARTLRNGDSFTFNTDLGAVDVLATPSGTSGYEDLVAGAEVLDLGGFPVSVVALDDLIRMKRAAGRVKDRIEVENLLALRDLRDEGDIR
jgi:hypothetical protein